MNRRATWPKQIITIDRRANLILKKTRADAWQNFDEAQVVRREYRAGSTPDRHLCSYCGWEKMRG